MSSNHTDTEDVYAAVRACSDASTTAPTTTSKANTCSCSGRTRTTNARNKNYNLRFRASCTQGHSFCLCLERSDFSSGSIAAVFNVAKVVSRKEPRRKAVLCCGPACFGDGALCTFISSTVKLGLVVGLVKHDQPLRSFIRDHVHSDRSKSSSHSTLYAREADHNPES